MHFASFDRYKHFVIINVEVMLITVLQLMQQEFLSTNMKYDILNLPVNKETVVKVYLLAHKGRNCINGGSVVLHFEPKQISTIIL